MRAMAIALSAGRVGLGLGLIARPADVAGGWVGPLAGSEEAGVLSRSVGIRDVALGAGAIGALVAGDGSARAWMLAQGLSDLGDIGATLGAHGSLPSSGVRTTLALAGGSAAFALLYARRSG